MKLTNESFKVFKFFCKSNHSKFPEPRVPGMAKRLDLSGNGDKEKLKTVSLGCPFSFLFLFILLLFLLLFCYFENNNITTYVFVEIRLIPPLVSGCWVNDTRQQNLLISDSVSNYSNFRFVCSCFFCFST